jgi:hypothetical protein
MAAISEGMARIRILQKFAPGDSAIRGFIEDLAPLLSPDLHRIIRAAYCAEHGAAYRQGDSASEQRLSKEQCKRIRGEILAFCREDDWTRDFIRYCQPGAAPQ